jgi:hypothetical protein
MPLQNSFDTIGNWGVMVKRKHAFTMGQHFNLALDLK